MTPAISNYKYYYPVYIYPKLSNTYDSTNTKITSAIGLSAYTDWMFTKNFTTYAGVTYSSSLGSTTPKFVSAIKTDKGDNWIRISNMELLDKGYVIVCLVNSNSTNFLGNIRRRDRRFLDTTNTSTNSTANTTNTTTEPVIDGTFATTSFSSTTLTETNYGVFTISDE
jgi:hypothetical protein